MSRELEFDGYWTGEVVYSCDTCHTSHPGFPFSCQDDIDTKNERKILRLNGWIITEFNGRLIDSCCEYCRNKYIKKHTK